MKDKKLNKEDQKKNPKRAVEVVTLSAEEFYVSKIESLSYQLRDAILDLSLKFPELNTFERYILRLNDYESFIYIISLLHKCWCLIYPNYLFNTVPKDLSTDSVLDMFLAAESVKESLIAKIKIKEEVYKDFNPLFINYYKAYQQAGTIKTYFSKYIADLYKIFNSCADKWGIQLNDNFTISDSLKTKYTASQLKSVFKIISKDYSCCEDNERNLRIFLSMFNSINISPEGTIQWQEKSTSRSKEPSLASLYTLFHSLGIDMNLHNRIVICKFFTWANGSIKEDQIKSRISELGKQKNLSEAIKKALSE